LLKTVINRTGIEPQKLELEVTESVVQSNLLGLKVFSELKALGVGLAIDDFGTGYSSFASLKDLSVDCLKIDKYFTDGILSDSDSKYLVSSMIDIGRNLGYETIVEGVEKPEQINVLKDLGCKVVQGDVFSKPVNANELLHILERGSLLAKTRE